MAERLNLALFDSSHQDEKFPKGPELFRTLWNPEPLGLLSTSAYYMEGALKLLQ